MNEIIAKERRIAILETIEDDIDHIMELIQLFEADDTYGKSIDIDADLYTYEDYEVCDDDEVYKIDFREAIKKILLSVRKRIKQERKGEYLNDR